MNIANFNQLLILIYCNSVQFHIFCIATDLALSKWSPPLHKKRKDATASKFVPQKNKSIFFIIIWNRTLLVAKML